MGFSWWTSFIFHPPAFLLLQIHALESDLDSESRRRSEVEKIMRKQDRRVKEITFTADEDRKNQDRLQEVIDKLQIKCKSMKRQIEEAVSGKP